MTEKPLRTTTTPRRVAAVPVMMTATPGGMAEKLLRMAATPDRMTVPRSGH